MTDTTKNTPTTPTDENTFDFDAWLSGAKRAARYVTLYADGDALAQLARVQDAIKQAEDLKDRGLNDDDPRAVLREERDRLRNLVEKSKVEVRVEASIEDENQKVTSEVHKDMASKRAEVESQARLDATANAKALRLDDDDRQDYIRKHVAEQVDRVDAHEITWRVLADRVQVPTAQGWEPIGRDRLDSLRRRLGDAQVITLQDAWSEATTEKPEGLSVPTSPVR